jgi:hypothetical protein
VKTPKEIAIKEIKKIYIALIIHGHATIEWMRFGGVAFIAVSGRRKG